MQTDLEEVWKEIESWDLVNRDISLGSHLKGPAPNDAVNVLNSQISGKLPADFLDILRRHDGTTGWMTSFYKRGLLGVSEILETLDEIRGVAQDLLLSVQDEPGLWDGMSLASSGPVKSAFWSEHWIPFHVTDWSKTCFDFDPAEGGEMGQIVEVNWERGTVNFFAKNYVEFLRLCFEHLPKN